MPLAVLDTDVCSFLFKRDSRAEAYRPHLEGKTLCLSFQTVAELYQWAEVRNWGQARRTRLEEWLRNFVVLPYDDSVCRYWARIRAERQRKGHQISAEDAWIAACALRYDCPLISHNASDYADITDLVLITEVEQGGNEIRH